MQSSLPQRLSRGKKMRQNVATWHVATWQGLSASVAVSANLVALHKARICGKKTVALARLEWVTPEYVRAMHARREAEGHTRRETGLRVRYMDAPRCDPAPILCEECNDVSGHRATCQSFGDLDKLAALVARGEVMGIKTPSSKLVRAMMRYN